MERLINADVVAEALGVTRERVYQLSASGIIPTVRVGRRRLFSERRIRAWIDAGGSGLPGSDAPVPGEARAVG